VICRFGVNSASAALTRSGHPLAIIAARMRVLPSAKQDLSEVLIHSRHRRGDSLIFGKLDLGSWELSAKRAPCPCSLYVHAK
jgi:hypothetical protein